MLQPCPHLTWFSQTILPQHRCFFIWRGHHTLAKGKTFTFPSQMLQTNPTPYSLLVKHLLRCRTQLWHLWTRTASCDAIPRTLETLPGSMEEPFCILTNHANLQYWKSPRNLNWRTACWHADLQEYNYKIQHIPGKDNIPADALSWPPGIG